MTRSSGLRLAACAAAVTTAAALAACGGSSSSSGGGKLTIGVLYPYTGANADQGAVGTAGCTAGIGPVNAAGGAMGHKFQCKPFDTKGDPADAVPATNQMLASASPVMVIGASDDAVATAPIVTGAKIPNFATVGDPHFDTQTNQYFYRLTPSDALQGVALGYWGGMHGFKNAAAVFTSDLGAQTSVPPFRAEYGKLGGHLTIDLKLAPGASSYRTEVQKVLNSHPDAIVMEMDPQSATTFLTEMQQLNGGNIPTILTTQRASNSDWIQAVEGGIGAKAFTASIKTITPYVALKGPSYDGYKAALDKTGPTVKDPSQYAGHPYAISDYDAVQITALAMTEAKSTKPTDYNSFIPKVTAAAPGALVVHDYADGVKAIKAGKTIQYVGASGPLIFNQNHSAERAFSFDVYDPATKSMKPSQVIPGTALNN
jgi:ABC-type branched-subunit amino acid transport system substrate-binding protein